MRKMTHPFFHDASILVSVGMSDTSVLDCRRFCPFSLRQKRTLSGALNVYIVFYKINVNIY